ncbi:type VI secretion system tube protein Hcp [Pseudomonas sp. SWRI107]|uniref:type VI secretion system tube protein TssD n=1 Tax=Pseudomonas farsensis TaxID=2745492 RepID=UPI001646A6F4|nr:type VI secretion system tube protein TssD [Pseudomonas farsensis]MBV4533917.1 type VI secretion system tube protein Hcp [Pseudomonas farsensis]
MNVPAYMTIITSDGKNLTENASDEASMGNAYQEEHKDKIRIFRIEHEILTNTNPQSGEPVGACLFNPYKIICAVNRCKPLLLEEISKLTRFEQVSIEHYRFTSDQGKQLYYETTLTGAYLVRMKTIQPYVQNNDPTPATQEMELWFSYHKINERHVIASTEGTHAWNKPRKD